MDKHRVYNLIILDESGSMQSIKHATISGFNEIVQTIKEVEKQFPEQEHYVSFITFNGLGIKTLLDKAPVLKLSEINADSFAPNASTPLYDAIGFAAGALDNFLSGQTNFNVLVTILTDGEENASREFTLRQITQMINELKSKGWTFTYIGANQDVEKVAASLSIENMMQFAANDEDMKRMFEEEKESRMLFSMKLRNKEDVQRDYFNRDKDKNKS
ncbi:hypothetical protein C7N43_04910 [Sphingobacteriales bacterium UPWRP_1]|nr:hypothetical protein BVG80_06835 [Sphingobacteriales bacterium TSM_CSM]PSJ78163.1 hypothetical protein C7N43_04910 [Sphingobacteriales bacterium UPWRP_1]